MSRRAALSSLSIAGVGLLTACARAVTPTPQPIPIAGAGSATPSAFASPTAAGVASPSASSSASATAGVAAEVVAPSPVASRSMPVATADAVPSAAAATAATSPQASVRLSATAYASGASCLGVASGEFGRWRGTPVEIAATWAQDSSTYFVDSGNEYGAWDADLDYAPQYDLKSTGKPFSWTDLAAGRYDSRLAADMSKLKARWAGRTGTLYYRFQHEFNGNWYPWSVDESTTADMVTGWRRMVSVHRAVFGRDPRFKVVWGPNGGSAPFKFKDIRSTWPGADYVDVISIDYYDFFKPQSTGDFANAAKQLDGGGGPVGILAWQRFAEQNGKPWAVSEWGNQYGDNPLYIRSMQDVFNRYAYSGNGSAAGRLAYQVYFNMGFNKGRLDGGEFRVEVDGKDAPFRPSAARAYRELFGA